jgi:hypothetical protein
MGFGSCGYGGEYCNQGYNAPVSCGMDSSFALFVVLLIVVLFILLIIIGAVIFLRSTRNYISQETPIHLCRNNRIIFY